MPSTTLRHDVVKRPLDDAVVIGVPDGFGAIAHVELPVDVRQVELHRLLRQKELFCDLLVRSAGLKRLENRVLALGQVDVLGRAVRDVLD